MKTLSKITVVVWFLFAASFANANNLTITNVSLGSRDPGTKTLVVKFDLSWENSWRNKINHDAVWLTVRLNNSASSPIYRKLCQVSLAGMNPIGASRGTNAGLESYVPADKMGAFLRRSSSSSIGNVATVNAQLTINYDSCGFSDNDQVAVNLFGLEMVYIPLGSFYAGDFNASTASLNKGTADIGPWGIFNENAISVSNTVNNGFRYVSNGNSGEYDTGSTFSIPSDFPKGYKPVYVMKHEITEGQWVDFVNSLPTAEARAGHDLTDNMHKNSDSVIARNTIACSGSPLTCTSQRPARAVGFLTWMDLAAFLDWAALRPMTELEFEKVSRGPVLPMAGEYVWGTSEITAADNIQGNEDGSEGIATPNANAHYGNAVLSGGDASEGGENQAGPLRNGIFATLNSTRVTSGASYYGVMDLAGNLKERIVTMGNALGLEFTGKHGNGELSGAVGFEGYGDVEAWPGLDAVVSHGITGANGSGFRGGSWVDGAERLRISDRYEAVLTSSAAAKDFGGRGARTYDGN